MKLFYQNRSGVLPEHKGAEFCGAHFSCCRLTIPAREALLACGALIEPVQAPEVLDPFTRQWVLADSEHYSVSLRQKCPADLVVCQIANGSSALCIRRRDEPKWPGCEVPDIWRQVDLTPCPMCSSALVWYEAGYVPGYRVCAGPEHHHWLAG